MLGECQRVNTAVDEVPQICKAGAVLYMHTGEEISLEKEPEAESNLLPTGKVLQSFVRLLGAHGSEK